MKEIKYNSLLRETMDQLQKGAFLTTSNKDQVNTMTIAWGNVGFMWNKPVFTVMVRPSRYTYGLIDKSEDFTVSLPINEDMKKALSYCGSQSGRDQDKIKDLALNLVPSQEVHTPIIGDCSLHYECRIIGKQEMDKTTVIKEIDDKAYSSGDHHTFFYGEIVKCYVTES